MHKFLKQPVGQPSHYNPVSCTFYVQPVDLAVHCSFALGNLVKYVCRAGKKDDILADYAKAIYYAKLVDVREQFPECAHLPMVVLRENYPLVKMIFDDDGNLSNFGINKVIMTLTLAITYPKVLDIPDWLKNDAYLPFDFEARKFQLKAYINRMDSVLR